MIRFPCREEEDAQIFTAQQSEPALQPGNLRQAHCDTEDQTYHL